MGGGGSKCSKQDHIDPKPSVDMSVGVTVAGSQGCKTCKLTYPQGNTASTVSLTRHGNMIVIKPLVPFTAVFNGRTATFAEIRLFYPSPVRVEGVQADAVIQCVDGTNLMVMIPLKKAGSGRGLSFEFLAPITSRLDPTTADGMGIKDEAVEDPEIMKTGSFYEKVTEVKRVMAAKAAGDSYNTITVPTGQNWALTNLVTDADPYFTWVNSDLEQYTRADSECNRYIGWRSTTGSQVIFYQNPVAIPEADLVKLTTTVGPVIPEDVIAPVMNPLYMAGRATGCTAPLPPLKLPKMQLDAKLADLMMYIFLLAAVLLAVVVAVAIVNSDSLDRFAKGFARLFSWGTPAKAPAAPPPVQAPDPLAMLTKLGH